LLKDQHLFPFTIELTEEQAVCNLPFLENLKVLKKNTGIYPVLIARFYVSGPQAAPADRPPSPVYHYITFIRLTEDPSSLEAVVFQPQVKQWLVS